MSQPRDRRFERVRAALHARLRIMEFEIDRHAIAEHGGNSYECTARACQTQFAFREREAMLREIIREFGGRA